MCVICSTWSFIGYSLSVVIFFFQNVIGWNTLMRWTIRLCFESSGGGGQSNKKKSWPCERKIETIKTQIIKKKNNPQKGVNFSVNFLYFNFIINFHYFVCLHLAQSEGQLHDNSILYNMQIQEKRLQPPTPNA